ncbi:MAG: SusC/RagA family TonB-linked outer membrane protein, partial [Prevotellaceae bacterium]|nr:SusC/RagA family TonB-linked outer membrane protein [Prevotellaceae bacterium]
GNITEDTRVFAPNDTEVSYENYKRRTSETQQTSLFLRSKTFIKLRELSISYAIPKTIYSKLGMKGANVALTGQNLFVWNKDVRFSDIDSESETINSPSIRYVGVNIKLNF